ncbi:peroxiredoxin, partial [Labrenzia sp. EL_126]|nr:peroxiredoxin [Labrenzia sp. EL_126]
MTLPRPSVNAPVPTLNLPKTDGGSVQIGVPKDRWTMLFVYRGKHCPRCKRFLNKLDAALSDWTAAMDVVVVSADTEEKAKA